jgi:competence protein ComEC
VLENFHPRQLWLGVDPRTRELQPLLHEAEELNIPVNLHGEDERFEFGGADVRVLAPSLSIQGRDPNLKNSRRNEESLVMRIAYGDTSALLEGDAEKATEQEMIAENPQADLLKVGHHGSNTSTTQDFLDAVRPRYAVISVGQRNVYGHPRREVLERLGEAKAATYRTDLDGAVSFFLDGKNVTARAADAP